MGTGSEFVALHRAHEGTAAEGNTLARGCRMPSWGCSKARTRAPAQRAAPSVTGRVAVELGTKLGWGCYVGWGRTVIGMRTFAPARRAGRC